MKLQDALFNWLQMKWVSDARPEDRAARDTLEFFAEILREDHQLTEWHVDDLGDDRRIAIRYVAEGQTHSREFDRDTVSQLLSDIESNPKYNE